MMKVYLILLVFGFMMTACVPSHRNTPMAFPSLSAIDSLMWRQPDSALKVMISFTESGKADSLDEFDGHYCQLLISELLYKNDYAQSNRLDLLKAVDYFDNSDNAFLSARAHYMNGVGYYERDSVVSACKAYLKALELMETHFPNIATQHISATHGATSISSDLLFWFMDLTYCRLEGLFSKQFMQEPAIVCCKRALAFDTICSFNPYNTSSLFLNLGLQYNKLYELNKEPYLADTADYYFNEALRHLPDTNNRIFIDVVTQLELLKINMGQDFEPSIIVLKRIAAQTLDETERLCSYLAIGGIYHSYNQYDSALVYLTPVFENKNDPYRQKVVAPYLLEIYLNTGDTVKAAHFARYIADNTSTEGESNAQVSTLNELFQQHLQWELDRAKEEDRQRAARHSRWIWMAIAGLLLLVAIAIVVARRGYGKRLKLQQEELGKQLEAVQDALKVKEKDALFTKVNAIYQDKLSNKAKRIFEAFNEAHPDALSKLKASYPDLTDTEVDICVLSHFAFRVKEIADILELRENTVAKYRSSIKKKTQIRDAESLMNQVL
jgi:DNA-binding CsgD family transcriptional regulator